MPAASNEKLNDLIQDCSLRSAQACFRSLCPSSFERVTEPLENPDTERFGDFQLFGQLPFDTRTLLFAYTEVKVELTERACRKAQFDAARAILKARPTADAGIFIFRGLNGAFRLSLISKIYKGAKAEFSHFRRYTYFVDPTTEGNGTFIRQIEGCAFDSLETIQEAFSVEAINKDFYKELANWYFWALPQVEFPADLEPDDEKRRATGLIRLLTRLIFCWFLKEKGLIPEKLFHPADLEKLLIGFDPESETSSTYYQAILQNLFFATLNQRMGKSGKGKVYRVFAKDEGFLKNRATYDINNLYRYEALFREGPEAALAHFADIPFLNGGLFECLDRTEESSPDNPVGGSSGNRDRIVPATFKKLYLDGFSRNPKKRPTVPDSLFFGTERIVDLSVPFNDTKRKREKVTGLISILNRYKFTIVENTPIDQEIALDPELLGKVFENLLASYNEETKTTARTQTGSFYTPRPIVDYMVDESLKAHLERKVAETILSRSPAETGLSLLPYNPDAPTNKTRQNLPHWTQDGTTYWITFRLADSLPQTKLTGWKAERDAWAKHHPEPWSESDWKEYNERFGDRLETWLDAGEGECHLRRSDVRGLVEKCLTHFDGERYDLHDWVIMPNHVHLLIRPREGHVLSKIMQGIKGVSAKECNALLNRTAQPFWQEESFDHIVRSEAQFHRFLRYIADNPLKAKLEDGEFSQSGRDNPVSVSPPNSRKSSSDNPVCVPPQTETGLSRLRSKLDQLFTYTEEPHQFTPDEVATLIAAIDEVKVLDPACGSGAFPMGVLHKLVTILGKLDPDNDRWKQTQLAKLDSAPMREQLEAAFADNDDDYGRKLYLIENCLYGVDIQPIAIQITKLRFFISLVCDQKTNRNKKDNHGIRPLPNLETKFVAANTLIGLPIPEPDLFIKNLIEPIEKEIEQVYHSHFNIQRRDQKITLQKRIKSLRQKLSEALVHGLGANKNSDVSKKAQHLADWDAFDPQASADFFDPHWMFGRSLADGFDVVLGNPPYIGESGHKELFRRTKEGFLGQFYMGKMDYFYFFFHAAIHYVKLGGCVAFITTNYFTTASGGRKLRAHIEGAATVEKMVNFGELKIFEAALGQHNLITILSKRQSNALAKTCETRRTGMSDAELLDSILRWDDTETNYFQVSQSDLFNGDNRYIRLTYQSVELPNGQIGMSGILDVVANAGISLGSIASINQGVVSGCDYVSKQNIGRLSASAGIHLKEGIFVFDYDNPSDTLNLSRFSSEENLLLRHFYKNSDIERYRSSDSTTKRLLYIGRDKTDLRDYPEVLGHLRRFKDILDERREVQNGVIKFFQLQWPRDEEIFGGEKIVLPYRTNTCRFAYNSIEWFCRSDCYVITKPAAGYDLFFLLAFLNSQICYCWLYHRGKRKGKMLEMFRTPLAEIPIPRTSGSSHSLLSNLARLRMAADGLPSPASFLEDLIDACVMECYFREHMAERDLLFQDTVAEAMKDYTPDATETEQLAYIETFQHRLIEAKIPERITRIPEASPDLLGVILKEGKV